MDNKVKVVICCGMSRSGSTLQYQLVREILEEADWGRGVGFPNKWDKKTKVIVKAERYAPWLGELLDGGKAVGLSIHRDPRQVALSLLHFYTKRSEWQDGPLPTWYDVIGDWLPDAIDWHNSWTAHGVQSFCYETLYDRLHRLAWLCAGAVGVDPTTIDIVGIAGRFSLTRQQERTDNMLKWLDNTDTLLTQSHISPSGGKKTWENKLTVNQIFDVQSVAGGWMERWNYALLDYCQDSANPHGRV